MARAYGANAQLLSKEESSYGVQPAGNYARLPFVQWNLGSEQGLIPSDVLGQGRDPQAPIRDVINVNGDVIVPVDVRDFGFWLKMIFGDPVTAQDTAGNYVHTFVSGDNDLPSFSAEVGMPEVPAYFMELGIRANGVQHEFVRSGAANATIPCIAQGEDRNNSSQGGTPTENTFTRFNQFNGSIKLNGSQLGNITRGTLNYSNNLEPIEVIRDDGKIDGADPTIAALTGTIDVRYADNTLIDLASSGTAVELQFAYRIDDSKSLIYVCHEIYLPKPKLAIPGPGGITASYDYQGAKDQIVGNMLSVLLTNDVASY